MTEASRSVLVVVDPQKAFVDHRGSLARVYGHDEILPNLGTWVRLKEAMTRARQAGTPVMIVRSEYRAGQFTGGRIDEPMGGLCVPGVNVDCEWGDGLDVAHVHRVVTKCSVDACGTAAYLDCVRDFVRHGVRIVYFAGFQLTTCVAATAISTAGVLGPQGVRSVVLKSASGARATSHLPETDGRSRVDRTCSELVAAGIQVTSSLEEIWRSF